MPKGDRYQNGSGSPIGIGVPVRRTGPMPMQTANDLSQTPGGTIFGTTPGGTRIIYDRDFLLQMRQSPAACTPPKNIPFIPGVTTTGSPKQSMAANGLVMVPENPEPIKGQNVPPANHEDLPFPME